MYFNIFRVAARYAILSNLAKVVKTSRPDNEALKESSKKYHAITIGFCTFTMVFFFFFFDVRIIEYHGLVSQIGLILNQH